MWPTAKFDLSKEENKKREGRKVIVVAAAAAAAILTGQCCYTYKYFWQKFLRPFCAYTRTNVVYRKKKPYILRMYTTFNTHLCSFRIYWNKKNGLACTMYVVRLVGFLGLEDRKISRDGSRVFPLKRTKLL